MKMNPFSKKRASNMIAKIANQNYFPNVALPINEADNELIQCGYRLVNEDGTQFQAIFCGATGHALIDIAPLESNEIVSNVRLSVNWYRMNNCWEVGLYLT